MSLRFLLILVLLLAIDLYVFQGVKLFFNTRSAVFQRNITWLFWSLSAFSVLILLMGQIIDWHSWPKIFRVYVFAMIFVLYFSKVIVLPFMLLDDLLRVLRWIIMQLGFFKSSNEGVDAALRISRLDFLVKTGFVIAAIPFVSLIYGMIGGAYNYTIHRKRLRLPHLPDAFDGIKIIQISDLHLGSFMGTEKLQKALDMIREEKPDLLFFTGDLVNDRYEETLPFREMLASLQAPLGVYAILGNHDYGDYYRWPSMEEKVGNLKRLKNFYNEISWKLLLNEHHIIERNGQQLGIIGVENWSARMNFQRYGDMGKAVQGMVPAPVNILLSHDPSHWESEILQKYPFVDLTLSGHTHGFQFGVEIPGFKWSPVQYVYKQWADLYSREQQYLYVNRGLGFIGYPGRVGISPEITIFNLQKS